MLASSRAAHRPAEAGGPRRAPRGHSFPHLESTVALFAIAIVLGRLALPPRTDVPVLLSITLLHMVGSVVGSRQCVACGADLEGRQGVACSDKCRAARWRRQRETTRQVRDREIRELLEAAM